MEMDGLGPAQTVVSSGLAIGLEAFFPLFFHQMEHKKSLEQADIAEIFSSALFSCQVTCSFFLI
jgi:hypothetical protein